MQRLRRWATKKHGLGEEIAMAVASTVIALALREALDGVLPPGFPFITFFPAVTLTAFFASTRAGIMAALGCGITAWTWYVGPTASLAQSLVAMGFFVLVTATDITLIDLMRRALVKLDGERQTSDALAQANKLMFHELQHRVSNNLQVVASILKMQQRSVADEGARAALDAASARLRIVSGIQRQLHNPKRQSADIAALLRDLLPEVMESTDSRAQLEVAGGGVILAADQATPVGLIVVELVSNALEHAAGADLSIRVEVKPGAEITVTDNGPGLPEGFAAERSRSLGLRIALQFTEQLGGTLNFASAGGTRAVLAFPA